jgi:hypothetical protein
VVVVEENLFGDKKQQPFNHLVSCQRRESHIKEKTVKHGGGDPLEWKGK